MCGPETLVPMLIGSKVVEIMGIANDADAKSSAAKRNADIQRQNARNARIDSSAKAQDVYAQQQYTTGQLRNSLALNSVNADFGTAGNLFLQDARNAAKTQNRIQQEGKKIANRSLNEAHMLDWQASNIMTQGYFNMFAAASDPEFLKGVGVV